MWYSTMNAVFRPAVLALLAVLVAACDPASRYRPREWQATDAADRCSSSLDGIRFTSTGIVAGLGDDVDGERGKGLGGGRGRENFRGGRRGGGGREEREGEGEGWRSACCVRVLVMM